MVMEEDNVISKSLNTHTTQTNNIAKDYWLLIPKKPNIRDLNYGQLGKCKEKIIPLKLLKTFKSSKGEKRKMTHKDCSIWKKTWLHTEGPATISTGTENLIELVNVFDTLQSVTFEDTSARAVLQLRRKQ